MKKRLTLASLSAALFLQCPAFGYADENADRRAESFKHKMEEQASDSYLLSRSNMKDINDRRALLKWRDGRLKTLPAVSIKLVETPAILMEQGMQIVQIPEDQDYDSTLKKIRNSSAVESIEPDYKKQALSRPNDKYYSRQWYLQKTNVPLAWNEVKAKKKVTVAVLDSGVDYNHPDLKGNILPGYDTVHEDANPMDDQGHGTLVAGIIAARLNNSLGVSGINPYAKILPVKVSDKYGRASHTDIIEGMYYAISQKADIINMSLGGVKRSDLYYRAVRDAYRSGILVVAAAGNEDSDVLYPAAYPETLSVGATDKNDFVTDFSNYGPMLDITAPGESINSTSLGGYEYADGTSFATPIVSGMASLLLAQQPELSPALLEYKLEKGAAKRSVYSELWNSFSGYGRADALKPFTVLPPNLAGDAGGVRTKAKPISLNKPMTDKYHLPGDSDWFKLTVSRSMSVKIELSSVAGMDGAVWVDKYAYRQANQVKMQDKAGISQKENLVHQLNPGIYYVNVYESNYHWNDVTPYTLKITELDTTVPPAPKVNAVDSSSTAVTGTAEKKAIVAVKRGGTTIGWTRAGSDGAFSVTIPKQIGGTVLFVTAKDGAGNVSKAARVVVEK
ncbi:S8 family serine peptidase [Fictibacillus iocasae]|uniref:S8 family serine peptidase n=1 Tax=Fictibacillus iocasae TaxID=2715437 RepID=A0ABW2NUQ2_9BACL